MLFKTPQGGMRGFRVLPTHTLSYCDSCPVYPDHLLDWEIHTERKTLCVKRAPPSLFGTMTKLWIPRMPIWRLSLGWCTVRMQHWFRAALQ